MIIRVLGMYGGAKWWIKAYADAAGEAANRPERPVRSALVSSQLTAMPR
jgi:hypothetical protein